MKYLITGGLGFLGSNLSNEVLKRNEELFIVDNFFRKDGDKNLKWLKEIGSFEFIEGDISNNKKVEEIVKNIRPDVIFHVAAQVAMTTSLKNPRLDFKFNTLGTFNILESIRQFSPDTTIIFSSSNKVYGDLEDIEYQEKETRYIPKNYPNGFDETLPLHFESPYGCSKGAADQYTLDYAKMFGLNSIVFRHSTIYGSRQFATFDQGWIGWFCQKAIETKKGKLKEPITIHGNGKQVRDILNIDDVIKLYFKASEKIEKIRGNVFNIGGGISNSFSLLELFNFLEKKLEINLEYIQLEPRVSDQKFFVADLTKIEKEIGWNPIVTAEEGIQKMIDWVLLLLE